MFDWLAPARISEIFTQEIAAARGKVHELFEDEARLFARSVLAPSTYVAPGDRLHGGVALRATESDIFVHPYVFRVVCGNGAIVAQATQTRHIARDRVNPFDVEADVRQAIRCSCEPEAFTVAADRMRSAKESHAGTLINMAAFLGSHSIPVSMVRRILRQYDEVEDRSMYGLMNAVTAVARDTKDPETKWRLESLGGLIPAEASSPPTPKPSRHARRIPVEAT